MEGRALGTASSRGANDMPKKKKSYKLGPVHKTIYGIISFYLPSTFLIKLLLNYFSIKLLLQEKLPNPN